MSVKTLHPEYKKKQFEVRQMRDTLLGPSNVKRAGGLYLPIPTAMFLNAAQQPPTGVAYNQGNESDREITADAPWSHPIPAYQSFLQRSRFPDITSLIHRGLCGVATKNAPEINLTESISYLEENATRDGRSLIEVFKFMVSEVLAVGEVSLLVDVDETNKRLVLVPYFAEDLPNWKVETVNDKRVPAITVFREDSVFIEDEFSHETKEKQKVCRNKMMYEGEEIYVYNVQDYCDEVGETITVPALRAQPYPEIPVVVARVSGTGFDTEWTCPLVGVSDISISIYQKDADMSNSEFLTCNPMLVFTGVSGDDDEVPDIIGSSVTWTLPQADSKAFYVEPKGNCLSHMATRISSMFDEAVQYGVSILGSGASSGEAAETVRMRQAGNSSNLRTIIESCAEALKDALEICEKWEKNSDEASGEIVFSPSLELTELKLTSQEQKALLESWLADGISHKTYLKNMLDAGIKLDAETIDEEINNISEQAPLPRVDSDLGGDE